MGDVREPRLGAHGRAAVLQPILQAAAGHVLHRNASVPVLSHHAAVVVHYPGARHELGGEAGVEERGALGLERAHLGPDGPPVRVVAHRHFLQRDHLEGGRMYS